MRQSGSRTLHLAYWPQFSDSVEQAVTVTACSTEKNDCEQYRKCSIRDPLWQIRERIVAALDTVTLAEMATDNLAAAAPVAVVRR